MAELTFKTNVIVNSGNSLKINKINAPTSSGGSYGYGSDGQVLKTNGSTVYWGDESGGGGDGAQIVGGTVSSAEGAAAAYTAAGKTPSDGDLYICY